MHSFDPLCVPSDLPGVNPAILNRMLLYYRLMTKWSGLGDSTELSLVGLSQLCHHYWVELHNFAPNAISQVATFVGICEGFLGIPTN
jgi:hypothetical protein